MRMGKLALRHGEMVRLVVRAADQQSDETEALNMPDLLWVARGDREQFPVRQLSSFRTPPLMAVHRLRPGGDHPLDGRERPVPTGDRDFQPAVDLFQSSLSLQRDLVHVDEMLAQGFEVDLRPVGLRIGVKDSDDLLDRAEGVLAGHRRDRCSYVHAWMADHRRMVLSGHGLG